MSPGTIIKISPFSYACPYACVCAATGVGENEIYLGHSITKRIFTARDYVWPMKTLDLDSGLHLNSLEGSDDFARSSVCVKFRFHLGHPSGY